MNKYTKGKVTAEVAKMRADQPAFGFTIRIEGKKPPICGLGVYQPDVATVSPEYRKICPEYFTPEEIEANANLISEAFNVAHETGLTPRQLLDVLRTIANGDYDNAHDPKAAARIARAAIAEADGATP